MHNLDTPVLNHLLEPLGRLLSPDVAIKLVEYRMDDTMQARLDKLASRCNEGSLTQFERREYETCVQTIEFIAILQAKARAILKRSPLT